LAAAESEPESGAGPERVGDRDDSVVIGMSLRVGLGADDGTAAARLAVLVVIAERAFVERDLAASISIGLDVAALLEHRSPPLGVLTSL
jgi:hypothetical protein